MRLIGVGVSRLTQKEMHQMSLFEWAEQNEEEEKVRREEEESARRAEEKRKADKARQDKLNTMMEKINGKFGNGTIKKGEK